MATQRDIALQMIGQLRVLDPSISADIGTPERKIIDTVAQAIAERQIDLASLEGAFDLDSKFGDDLDVFVSLFGFGRQKGAQSTGYVTFARETPSTFTIPIPSGTQVVAPSVVLDGSIAVTRLTFITSAYGEIPAGELEVTIPVRAVSVGALGNVATSAISTFGASPVLGITTVENEIPTTGGVDPESDNELKVRFRNTIFRNLAGTQDQFLALAVATQNTTKANVVGPISRYREYIQVPDVDDATPDPDSGVSGNGNAGEWTSALSTIPYSKYTYDAIPYYVTNGSFGPTAVFYRRDTDFRINTDNDSRNRGDSYRQSVTVSEFPYAPSICFTNVYEGDDTDVQAIRPGDVVLFEHSYMSEASRNDYDRRVLNCVDVFINGRNPTLADVIIAPPSGTANIFTTNSSSAFYTDSFRRIGESNRLPVAGNLLCALYWSPITDLPNEIITAEATYLKGVHYWAVEDVSEIGGSIRARTGIEWNPTVKGQASGDDVDGPYTGPTISSNTATNLEVIGYSYDRNIVDLQVALDGNKQVTTDVLGHQARTRYFKLDVTVMYSTGFSSSATNDSISAALSTFFDGQYFGTTIQMSDLLQVIHNVAGVDNVRWSSDLTTELADDEQRHKVIECDEDGDPLCTVLFDRHTYGHAGATETQYMYLTGAPVGGTFKIKYQTVSTAAINYNASMASINSALATASIPCSIASGAGTPTDPFIINFSSTGYRDMLTVVSNELRSETTLFDADFFLEDDELPAIPTGTVTGDAVPGVIIRPRAQNTWNQL